MRAFFIVLNAGLGVGAVAIATVTGDSTYWWYAAGNAVFLWVLSCDPLRMFDREEE
jgi:hypothetical protein